MLLPAIDLLNKASQKGYAVGAFNTSNLEITQAIIEVAEALNAPVIIATSEKEAEFMGMEYVVALVQKASTRLKIPLALHLDHAKSLESALKAIELGYTSVHIDGSALPFEGNVGLTLGVVEVARSVGVSVEGELGQIYGTSSLHQEIPIKKVAKKTGFTDPEKAFEFVKLTGVDSLAVAIGTAHGLYQGQEKLDFKRLAAIKKKVNIPLVLHGGSGLSEKSIKKAIKLGVSKINVNTELRLAYAQALRESLAQDSQEIVPYKFLASAKEAVKEVVASKIKLFGAYNQA